MIGAGSMVALKGHHLFPMVVKNLTYDPSPSLPPPGSERPPHNAARCIWLGANGQPYEAVYPLEILEQVDG